MPLSWQRVLVTLLIGVGIILAIFAVLLLLPGQTIDTAEGDAVIFFSADRRWVLKPADCVQVRWTVANIQAVFLNDGGVIGAGEAQVCLDQTSVPTLRVILSGGESRVYRLAVNVFFTHPLVWLLIAAALVLIAFAAYLVAVLPVKKRLSWAAAPLHRTLRIILRLAAGVLVIGLILELGLRFYLSNFGTERDKVLYLYTADEIRSRDRTTMGLPFLNFGLAPGGERNALGYRGPEIEVPKPPGIFRIVAMGSSETYGLGMGWESAYPAQLQKILREEYGYTNVEVVNAGVVGYSSWNTVVNLAFRVLELEPDVLIVYHGTNDLGARLVDPECYSGQTPHRGLNPNAGVWQIRPEPLSPSALYRYVAITLGWMSSPLLSAQPVEPVIDCARDRALNDDESIQANPPVYFERNLRSIVGLARVHHVGLVFSSWPYFYDADPMLTPRWWEQGIAENNEVTRRVARELDVPFYDLAANETFQHNADFWIEDGAHLSRLGTYEQARLYAAFLIEGGLLPASQDE